MSRKTTVTWLASPEDHDYPAAASYLSLLLGPQDVDRLVDGLRAATTSTFKAKDLLRASRLPLLPTDNPHVASDLAKIDGGKALSPVLLVRGRIGEGIPLTVADGYHRICASYHTDENTDIPAVVVDLP